MAKKKKKGKNGKENNQSDTYGCFPLFFSKDAMKKYNLLDSNGINLPYIYMNCDLILQEIESIGVLSEFAEIKSDLIKLEKSDFFLFFDEKSQFGKNYVACLFDPGLSRVKESFEQGCMQTEDTYTQAYNKRMAEKLAQENEYKEWLKRNTYHDKVITPKCYKSSTAVKTVTEISHFEHNLLNRNFKIELEVLEKADKTQLTSVSALTMACTEYTHYIDPNYDLELLVLDKIIQTNSSYLLAIMLNDCEIENGLRLQLRSVATGTQEGRLRNKQVQTQHISLQESEKADFITNNKGIAKFVPACVEMLEKQITFSADLNALQHIVQID